MDKAAKVTEKAEKKMTASVVSEGKKREKTEKDRRKRDLERLKNDYRERELAFERMSEKERKNALRAARSSASGKRKYNQNDPQAHAIRLQFLKKLEQANDRLNKKTQAALDKEEKERNDLDKARAEGAKRNTRQWERELKQVDDLAERLNRIKKLAEQFRQGMKTGLIAPQGAEEQVYRDFFRRAGQQLHIDKNAKAAMRAKQEAISYTNEQNRLHAATAKLNTSLEKGTLTYSEYRAATKKVKGELEILKGHVVNNAIAQQTLGKTLSFNTRFHSKNAERLKMVTKAVQQNTSVTKQNAAAIALQVRMQRSLGQSLVKRGKDMQWLGRQLTMGITFPLVMGARRVVEYAEEVDRQLTRVEKVYNGVGPALDEVRVASVNLARDAARELGFLASESLEVQANFAQMGFTLESGLEQMTNETLRIARLGEIEMEAATNLVRSTAQVFGLEGQALTDTLNRFNKIENETALGLKELAVSLPIVSSVAAQLGLSAEETAASIAVLKEAGVEANVAATALRTSLARLTDPTDEARKTLAEFGVDLDTLFSRNDNNALAVLQELGTLVLQMKDNAPGLIEAFGEIVGVRQADRLIKLVDGLNDLNVEGSSAMRAFAAANSDAGEAARSAAVEMERFQESASGTAQRLEAELNFQLAELGQQILPFVNDIRQAGVGVLKFINAVIDGFDKFLNIFGPLKGTIKNFFGAFVVGALAMGPIIMSMGLLKNAIGTTIDHLGLIKGAWTGAAHAEKILNLETERATLIEERNIAVKRKLAVATDKSSIEYREAAIELEKLNNALYHNDVLSSNAAAAQATNRRRVGRFGIFDRSGAGRLAGRAGAKGGTRTAIGAGGAAFGAFGVLASLPGALGSIETTFSNIKDDSFKISDLFDTAMNSAFLIASAFAAGGPIGAGIAGAALALTTAVNFFKNQTSTGFEDSADFANQVADAMGLASAEAADISAAFAGVEIGEDPLGELMRGVEFRDFLLENQDISDDIYQSLAGTLIRRGADEAQYDAFFGQLAKIPGIDVPRYLEDAAKAAEYFGTSTEAAARRLAQSQEDLTNTSQSLSSEIKLVNEYFAALDQQQADIAAGRPGAAPSIDPAHVEQAVGAYTSSIVDSMFTDLQNEVSRENWGNVFNIGEFAANQFEEDFGSRAPQVASRAMRMLADKLRESGQIEFADRIEGLADTGQIDRAMAEIVINEAAAGNEAAQRFIGANFDTLIEYFSELPFNLQKVWRANIKSWKEVAEETGREMGKGMNAELQNQLTSDFISAFRSNVEAAISDIANAATQPLRDELDAMRDRHSDEKDDLRDIQQDEKEGLREKLDLEDEVIKGIRAEIDAIKDADKERDRAARREKIRRDLLAAESQGALDIASAIAAGDLSQAASIRQSLISERLRAAAELRAIDEDDKKDENKQRIDDLEEQLEDEYEKHEDAMDTIHEAQMDRLEDRQKAEVAAQEERIKNLNEEVTAQLNAADKTAKGWKVALKEVDGLLKNHNINIGNLDEMFGDAWANAGEVARTEVANEQKWADAASDIVSAMGDRFIRDIDDLFNVLQGIIEGDYSVDPTTGRIFDASGNTIYGGLRSHSGGYISGPSAPGLKPDETPRILQNGEYVLRKRAVDSLGVGYLNGLNRMHDGGLVDIMGQQMYPSMLGRVLSMMDSRLSYLIRPFGFGAQLPDLSWNRGDGEWAGPGENGLVPHMARAMDAMTQLFSGISVSPDLGRDDETSDHGRGKAIDIFPGNGLGQAAQGAQLALGNRIVSWLVQNEDLFGLKNLIWQGQINTGTGWRRYRRSGRSSGVTGGHYDHIHASFLPFMDGGITLKDNIPALLHKNEAVLKAPLPKQLIEGIQNMNSGSGGNHYEFNIGEFHGTEANAKAMANYVIREIEKRDARMNGSRRIN